MKRAAVILLIIFSGCGSTRTLGDLCTTARFLSATANALCALRDTSHVASPEFLAKQKALGSQLDSLETLLRTQAADRTPK